MPKSEFYMPTGAGSDPYAAPFLNTHVPYLYETVGTRSADNVFFEHARVQDANQNATRI